jgi:hypothetical protein
MSVDSTTIESELEQLGRKVRVLLPDDSDVLQEDKAEVWKKVFGMHTPKALLGVLKGDCKECVIHISERGNAVSLFYNDGRRKAEVELGLEATGSFSNAHMLELDTFQSDPNGSGLAKKVLGNLQAFTALYPNMQGIEMAAALTGAYAWARFGFVPAAESWQSETDDSLRHLLIIRTEALGDQLSRKEKAALAKIINSTDPKSIWLLADMAKPIAIPDSMRKEFDDHGNGESHMTLGKYLLLNTEWEGHLRFSDTQAMARFNGYLAKVAAVEPKRPATEIAYAQR